MKSDRELADLIREGLRAALDADIEGAEDDQGAPDPIMSPSVTDEQIAGFVTGELPEAERRIVVVAAGRDPAVAAAIAALHDLGLARLGHETPSPAPRLVHPATSGAPTMSFLFRWRPAIAGGLALAACVTLLLLAWTVVDPAPTLSTPTFDLMNAQAEQGQEHPDHIQELQGELRGERLARYRLRDYVLYISVATTGILALVISLIVLRGHWRRADGARKHSST